MDFQFSNLVFGLKLGLGSLFLASPPYNKTLAYNKTLSNKELSFFDIECYSRMVGVGEPRVGVYRDKFHPRGSTTQTLIEIRQGWDGRTKDGTFLLSGTYAY
uniref:Lipid A biosynthesis lauroyl acyltransferase n=1 Tax=Lygus hesperus TaxID=30085 RepID=A0A0A9YCM8_LYGHE